MPRKADSPRLVRRGGRRKWYILDGDRRTSTGTEDRAEAQRILDAFLDARARPVDPTVAQLLDARYRDCETRGVVRLDNIRWQHRWLREHFGHLRPADLTQPCLERYWRARGQHPTALRRELEELRATLRHAHLRYDHIALPANRPPGDKWLSEEQAARLVEAAGAIHHIRLWCLIALITGRRKGAILDLTWDRVDLDRAVIDFDNPDRQRTKKRRGAIGIPRALVAALRDARQVAVTSHVIEWRGKPVKGIEGGFAKVRKAAGLAAWVTPHVLKHTCISRLAERWPVDKIADYTETHPETVRRIYRKVNGEALREMGEDIAGTLFRAHRANNEIAKPSATKELSWLGDLDSNQGCPVQSRKFYR
jgi:integrase